MFKTLDTIVGQIREDLDVCYLDTGALSIPPKEVTQAICDFHERRRSQGPDFDSWWRRADDLRALTAQKIGAQPYEIMFIQNTSMGINLAAGAIPFEPGDNVIITDMEFPSNAYPWYNLVSRGVEVRAVQSRGGDFLIEDFERLCDERTRAISVSWVIAANGTVVDINKLGALCRKLNVWYIIDAIQGFGAIPIDVEKACADFVASGYFKWQQGPDGFSFAYIRQSRIQELRVPFTGWAGMKDRFDYSEYRFDLAGVARRYESGTMNFSAIYGAAAAMELLTPHQEEITRRMHENMRILRAGLQALEPKGLRILSPRCKEASGLILIDLPDTDGTFIKLRERKIRVNKRGGIRISPFYYNNSEDINRLLEAIEANL